MDTTTETARRLAELDELQEVDELATSPEIQHHRLIAAEQVQAVRSAPQSALPGLLARTIQEALTVRTTMRHNGASELDIDRGFEQVIRDVWPFTREWKYLCAACQDCGLVITQCPGDDETCGRQAGHLAHEFGKPCWCPAGGRFRKAPMSPIEDADTAGKTKAKPMARFGR
jgi:hypothetical protein